MWTALRALEEGAKLRRRMAERSQRGNFRGLSTKYLAQAGDLEARAAVIRKVLVSEPSEARHMKGVTPKRGRPGHVNSQPRNNAQRHKSRQAQP